MQVIEAQLPKLWERLDSETEEAYQAFAIYRDLDLERSQVKVATELGKSTTLIERWSARHNWRARVLAWDRYNARVINQTILMGTAEMRKRHITQSQHMQFRAAKRLTEMTDLEIKSLTPSQVVAFFKASVDAERQARDIPDLDLDEPEDGDSPHFTIQVIKGPEEGMNVVRVDDQTGYIPRENLERFLEAYPNAVVIQ